MSGFNDKNPGACECCEFETKELTKTDAYARTPGHGPFTPDEAKEWAWLCYTCRATHVGNMHLYPRNYEPDTAMIMKTIAWGINEIKRVMKGA